MESTDEIARMICETTRYNVDIDQKNSLMACCMPRTPVGNNTGDGSCTEIHDCIAYSGPWSAHVGDDSTTLIRTAAFFCLHETLIAIDAYDSISDVE